jgi:hypothetical protein
VIVKDILDMFATTGEAPFEEVQFYSRIVFANLYGYEDSFKKDLVIHADFFVATVEDYFMRKSVAGLVRDFAL